jgi:hypothetical protein
MVQQLVIGRGIGDMARAGNGHGGPKGNRDPNASQNAMATAGRLIHRWRLPRVPQRKTSGWMGGLDQSGEGTQHSRTQDSGSDDTGQREHPYTFCSDLAMQGVPATAIQAGADTPTYPPSTDKCASAAEVTRQDLPRTAPSSPGSGTGGARSEG